MSFVHKGGAAQSVPMRCGTSSSVTVGSLLTFDRTNGIVILGTATLLAEDAAGVAMNTPVSADTEVSVMPIITGDLWEWDCTNNTATNQLCKRSLLTDSLVVANTSTDITTNVLTVTPLSNVGAVANKKQYGYINLVPATLS